MLFSVPKCEQGVRLQTKTFLATLFVVNSTVAAQSPAPLSVVVEGASRTVSAAELQKLPRDTARMVFHDAEPVTYQGVSLAGLLRTVGVRTDSLRGPALDTRLVIEALDGYQVVLTLADLDPSLGGRRILLADRVDGKALPADEAPWRLIVTGDQRPSRSARQVVTIRVIPESR